MERNKKKEKRKTTRRTKSEQHKQDQSAAVFNKELCINAIRCFSANNLSLLEFLPPIR